MSTPTPDDCTIDKPLDNVARTATPVDASQIFTPGEACHVRAALKPVPPGNTNLHAVTLTGGDQTVSTGKPQAATDTQIAQAKPVSDSAQHSRDQINDHQWSHGQHVQTHHGETDYTSADSHVTARVSQKQEQVSAGDSHITIDKTTGAETFHNTKANTEIKSGPDGTVVAKHADGSTVESSTQGTVERDAKGRIVAEHTADSETHHLGRDGNVHSNMVLSGESADQKAREIALKGDGKTHIVSDAQGNRAIVTKQGDIIEHQAGSNESILLDNDDHGHFIEHKLTPGSAESEQLLKERGYTMDAQGRITVDKEVTVNSGTGTAVTHDQDDRKVTVTTETAEKPSAADSPDTPAKPTTVEHTEGGQTTAYTDSHPTQTTDPTGKVVSTYDGQTQTYKDHDFSAGPQGIQDIQSGAQLNYDTSVVWQGVVNIGKDLGMVFDDGTSFMNNGGLYDNGQWVSDWTSANDSSTNSSDMSDPTSSAYAAAAQDASQDIATDMAVVQSTDFSNLNAAEGTLEWAAGDLSADMATAPASMQTAMNSALNAVLEKLSTVEDEEGIKALRPEMNPFQLEQAFMLEHQAGLTKQQAANFVMSGGTDIKANPEEQVQSQPTG